MEKTDLNTEAKRGSEKSRNILRVDNDVISDVGDLVNSIVNQTMLSLGEEKQCLSKQEVTRVVSDFISRVSDEDLRVLLRHQDEYCDRCANCCKHSDPIAMSLQDAMKIAFHLGTKFDKFRKKYGVNYDRDLEAKGVYPWIMKGKPCPFLKEPNFCSIYEVRPAVCRAFPAGAEELRRKYPEAELPSYCHSMIKWQAKRVTDDLLRNVH